MRKRRVLGDIRNQVSIDRNPSLELGRFGLFAVRAGEPANIGIIPAMDRDVKQGAR